MDLGSWDKPVSSTSPFKLDFGSAGSLSNLPSRPTVPNSSSGLPGGGLGESGGMPDGGGDAFDWKGAVGEFAPLLAGLFGNNPYEKKTAGAADDMAALGKSLVGEGKGLAGEGKAALAPVLQFLQAVAGGDQTALMQATMPERKKIIDQYDTAKQSLKFAPRGGGTASAMLDIEGKEASDLAINSAEAHRSGVRDLGTLGMNLTSQGINAQAAGGASTANAATTYGKLQESKKDSLGGFGQVLGKALPFILAAI